MNKREIKRAIRLLDEYTERTETIIDGTGQSLTAYWVDGGQKLFTSIEQVENWVADRER
jgi:hypothetical protein